MLQLTDLAITVSRQVTAGDKHASLFLSDHEWQRKRVL
jgi:hypothetical protein